MTKEEIFEIIRWTKQRGYKIHLVYKTFLITINGTNTLDIRIGD